MSKKSVLGYLGLLVLSVVVTHSLSYILGIFDISFSRNGFGIPFAYGSSTFFGGSSFDSVTFMVDIIFWFAVIWIVWKFIRKLLKKS